LRGATLTVVKMRPYMAPGEGTEKVCLYGRENEQRTYAAGRKLCCR
jgi:hypothetical protein